MESLPDLHGDVDAELERELRAQADELDARLKRSRARLERLEGFVAALRAQVKNDQRALTELNGLLGHSDQSCLESTSPALRGARLREVAVRILAERSPEHAVHYRQWFEWVQEEGYEVSGRDPLASFLAQITRHEDVRRVGGQRSGRYALRDD
jgi:hypothetical protein